MASKPYFDRSKGAWYIKWKSITGWQKARLGTHPGWSKGDPIPKRPTADAIFLAREWEDREVDARRGVDAPSRGRPEPLKKFLDDYLSLAEAGQTAGSLTFARRAARTFAAWCEGRKVSTVSQVTAEVCRQFLADRSRRVKRSTVKTERAYLSPAWSHAYQDGKVAENPWRRAPVPGKAREERPPFWSEDEVAKLVAACRPWLADVVVVGAYSGLRVSALLGLTWEDIDFDKGAIRVRASESKSGRTYEAPLLEPARAVLERGRRSAGDEPLVFPGTRSGRRVQPQTTHRMLGKAIQRAGIPNHGRIQHALRHSFATWSVNRGVPLAVVSRWLGHSNIQQTMRYSHNDPSESKRWAEFFGAGGHGEVKPPS